MSPIAEALKALAEQISEATTHFGHSVDVQAMRVTNRHGQLALASPTTRSPNGACRMVRAVDGWLAVNLARDEDRELVPAWLRREVSYDPWVDIARRICELDCAELIADAVMLGLPVARVGEVECDSLEPRCTKMSRGPNASRGGQLRVLDFSALWAGPLCCAVLARMGASVTRAESLRRPDPMRIAAPEFFQRLNGLKAELPLDLSTLEDRGRLLDKVLTSDVIVTSARPLALEKLGLSPEIVFAENPSVVWVAITGYGWSGECSLRVAFGDDAAAAGNLVYWSPKGTPRFLGDALADPITGLSAAIGALEGLKSGGGAFVDAALAKSAAAVAASYLRRSLQ